MISNSQKLNDLSSSDEEKSKSKKKKMNKSKTKRIKKRKLILVSEDSDSKENPREKEMREPKRLFTRVYIRKHKGKIEMLDEEGNKIEKIAKVKEADIEKVSEEGSNLVKQGEKYLTKDKEILNQIKQSQINYKEKFKGGIDKNDNENNLEENEDNNKEENIKDNNKKEEEKDNKNNKNEIDDNKENKDKEK